MESALGLLALVPYIAGVIGAAAGITWAVVKLTPTRKHDEQSPSS